MVSEPLYTLKDYGSAKEFFKYGFSLPIFTVAERKIQKMLNVYQEFKAIVCSDHTGECYE